MLSRGNGEACRWFGVKVGGGVGNGVVGLSVVAAPSVSDPVRYDLSPASTQINHTLMTFIFISWTSPFSLFRDVCCPLKLICKQIKNGDKEIKGDKKLFANLTLLRIPDELKFYRFWIFSFIVCKLMLFAILLVCGQPQTQCSIYDPAHKHISRLDLSHGRAYHDATIIPFQRSSAVMLPTISCFTSIASRHFCQLSVRSEHFIARRCSDLHLLKLTHV